VPCLAYRLRDRDRDRPRNASPVISPDAIHHPESQHGIAAPPYLLAMNAALPAASLAPSLASSSSCTYASMIIMTPGDKVISLQGRRCAECGVAPRLRL
jgi:hypothetical protein